MAKRQKKRSTKRRKQREKIRYVQFDAQSFVGDLDWQRMKFEEKGVYATLVIHLYAEQGELKFDVDLLKFLCSNEEFEAIWEGVKHKFNVRRGVISHNTVTEDLEAAQEYRAKRSQAGRVGAAKRWQPTDTAITPPKLSYDTAIAKERKKRKGKGGELTNGKEETELRPSDSLQGASSFSLDSFPSSSSLTDSQKRQMEFKLNNAIRQIIPARTNSDTTALANVCKWVVKQYVDELMTPDSIARVMEIARSSKSAANPPAYFLTVLKKEMRYRPISNRKGG